MIEFIFLTRPSVFSMSKIQIRRVIVIDREKIIHSTLQQGGARPLFPIQKWEPLGVVDREVVLSNSFEHHYLSPFQKNLTCASVFSLLHPSSQFGVESYGWTPCVLSMRFRVFDEKLLIMVSQKDLTQALLYFNLKRTPTTYFRFS